MEQTNRHIRLSFRFGNINSWVTSIKKFDINANQLILTKIVNLNLHQIHNLYKSLITMQTSVKLLRAITMCKAFTPNCIYENSDVEIIGNMYCPNTTYSIILYVYKKIFQLLGRSDYQCPKGTSVCKVRDNPFKQETNSFFLQFDLRIYIFEETQKFIQNVIRETYCPRRLNKKCFYFSSNKKTKSPFFTTAKVQNLLSCVEFSF